MTHDAPEIRPATDDDLVGVMRVLDAGLLDTDAETIRRRIAETDSGSNSESKSVLVADAEGRVVGAVVLGERPAWVAEVFDAPGDSTTASHVDAVAVGRSRRGQGLGTDLLQAAVESVDGDVTADFTESVRPFYESLGCSIRRRSQDGVADGDSVRDGRLVARIGRVGAIPEASGDGEADG